MTDIPARIIERCARVAEAHAPYTEEAIKGATSEDILSNSFGVTKSRIARQIAAAIRALANEKEG